MTDNDRGQVAQLLRQAGLDAQIDRFKRVASARALYHWNVEAAQEY